jgi:hypothetical protein
MKSSLVGLLAVLALVTPLCNSAQMFGPPSVGGAGGLALRALLAARAVQVRACASVSHSGLSFYARAYRCSTCIRRTTLTLLGRTRRDSPGPAA